MGKAIVIITLENDKIHMKTQYKDLQSDELAELIVNLEILEQDLKEYYKSTIKKSENKF